MKIKRTSLFERQLKRLARKHLPISVLKPCLRAIVEKDSPKLTRIKDHALKGKWKGYREFHPARYGGGHSQSLDNWIVIYRLNPDELILLLVATGSHEVLDQ